MSKERLWVLALAAGALALFYLLFFPSPKDNSAEVVRPLSSESRPEGYLAVWRWLAEQHIRTVSLRYRYDRLDATLLKPRGNLLLVTLPQWVPARAAELEKLNSWVESGNTLLVMAAINDTPPWSLDGDPLLKDKLKQLTGMQLESPPAKKTEKGGDTTPFKPPNALRAVFADRIDIIPRGEHPLLAGVRHITAASKLPIRNAYLNSPEDNSKPLQLATRADSGAPALWLMRKGNGQIILSSVSSPFANGSVVLTDNAQLLANIIAWCCGSGATVVFDDAHQGAADYYDGRAFFADSRLHHTLEWIVFVWLALLIGALPLRAVQRSWRPIDEGAYVETSARYFASVVPADDAARRLIENFLLRLTAGVQLDLQTRLWTAFDGDTRVSDRQRRDLHALYEKACAGERVNLVRLQNLLTQLQDIFV